MNCIEDVWMRKVGIMSMQRIANYGSFLQAYALKQLIEEVGCNVEFVDYHVGAPVITENADSKNKVVRKIEKGLGNLSVSGSSCTQIIVHPIINSLSLKSICHF